MGIFGQERVYPDEVPGPEDIFKTKKKKSCCEFVNWLDKEAAEEEKAYQDYRKSKDQIASLHPGDWESRLFGEIINNIADDEKKHKNYLKAISSVLSDFCKCDHGKPERRA